MREKKKYKYLINGGYAFDEEKITKKLSDLSKEGWILESVGLFRYKLVKGECNDYIYSMDYNESKEDLDEYFDIFKSGGWDHVYSTEGFHFFRANRGTTPIYTDKESYKNKYEVIRSRCNKMGIISGVIMIFIILLGLSFKEILNDNNLLFILYLISIAMLVGITVPSVMVSFAYYFRKRKIQKEN